ncbi:hypothetical protein C0J52_05266 [Blattella germanica]|nr:hypothetical protein C0J52_05266 [Blattella germanica]
MRRHRKQEDEEDNGFASWFSEDAANEEATKSDIFNGISIFVNGYTVPSADGLKRLMMLHGGVYHQYQTDRTTHVIASNLPNCKMKQIKTTKIVKPDWIVDSIKANQLLDYRQYLLYVTQPALNFDKAKVLKEECHSNENILSMIGQGTTKPNEEANERNGGEICSRPITKTAAESGFLSEFYNNSRLHHISTMGATFKQYVSELREASDGSFPSRTLLCEWKTEQSRTPVSLVSGRVIMHIDMDCFFVSVGLRDKPHLQGVPVAVTHGKGNSSTLRKGASRAFEVNYYRQKYGMDPVENVDETESLSEIASCSYEARKLGITNGMFLGTALKFFTLDIEAVSCDEMFVDCTDVLRETSTSALDFSEFLRQQIKNKTGCPASAGFGSNRLQARLATKKAKPNGQFYLEQSAVSSFMLDVKMKDLPDLKSQSLSQLQKEFGAKTGSALYKHCRGEDDRPLNFGHQRKSVSAEVNYGIRFTNQDEFENFLKQLSDEVATRLKTVKSRGRCITLKVMIRAKEAPVETAKFLGHGVLAISRQLNLNPSDLRGIGIQVSRLEKTSTQCGALDGFLKRGSSVQESRKEVNSPIKNQESHISNKKSVSAQYPSTEKVQSIVNPCKKVVKKLCSSGKIIQEKQQSQHSDRNSKNETIPDSPVSLYSSMSEEEVRALVIEWVASEDVPQKCDIDMLAEYLEKQYKS